MIFLIASRQYHKLGHNCLYYQILISCHSMVYILPYASLRNNPCLTYYLFMQRSSRCVYKTKRQQNSFWCQSHTTIYFYFIFILTTCFGQWRTQEFCSGGGVGSTNSVEDRKNGDLGGGSPHSQGFWRQLYFGTRNFISYRKIFVIFGTLRLFMMTTNLFVTVNVKELRTSVLLEFYCLFSENILGCWRPKFSSF